LISSWRHDHDHDHDHDDEDAVDDDDAVDDNDDPKLLNGQLQNNASFHC
jgi:hypothetical protein